MRPSRLLLCLAATPLAAQRPAGTIVVTNMRDHTATILDAATNRVVATLATGEGPHEVAVSHDGRWAVVSNYGVRERPGNTLSVIDLDGLTVVRTIDVSPHRRPHGITFLPGDSVLAVTSETSQAVLLVRLADGQIAGTVPTGGRASHMIAVPSGQPTIAFVGNIADATISLIDLDHPGTPEVFKVARQPEGIAVSPDAKTVWVGSNADNVVLVVSGASGEVLDTLRDFGLPYRMAVTPDGNTAVISDPVKGQVRIFDARNRKQKFLVTIGADSLVATAEVPGSPSPEGVALSRDSKWAFVTLQGRNRVITLDLATGKIVGSGVTGTWSDGVAYSPRSPRS